MKRILRYIRGIMNYGIHYAVDGKTSLLGNIDSNWGNYPINRKYIGSYMFEIISGPMT